MKFKKGDIVKIVNLKRLRWKYKQNFDFYFKNKIGIVTYIKDSYNIPYDNYNYCVVAFYLVKGRKIDIMAEVFRFDELGLPSESELKEFQLILEKVNAKRMAEKL